MGPPSGDEVGGTPGAPQHSFLLLLLWLPLLQIFFVLLFEILMLKGARKSFHRHQIFLRFSTKCLYIIGTSSSTTFLVYKIFSGVY